MKTILKFGFLMLFSLSFSFSKAQKIYNSPVFKGMVHAIVEDANYVYVGGVFDSASDYDSWGYGLISANNSGTGIIDKSFPTFDGDVNAIVSDNSGGWFIAGNFTKAGTFTRNGIVHILADKSVDPNWDPNISVSNIQPNSNTINTSRVHCLAISGTNLYVGGSFTTVGGQTRNSLAKISTLGNGGLDPSWNPNVKGEVFSMTISGSDLYVGGQFTSIGGQDRSNIAKLSINGTGAIDNTWNPGCNNTIQSMVISGSDLYVGGTFNIIAGLSRNSIAKISTQGTGSIDAIWNPNCHISNANGIVFSMAVSGTDLYVGGWFNSIGGRDRMGLAKLTTTGSGAADASWNPSPNTRVTSIAINNGDIYVSGDFNTIGGQSKSGVAKLSSNGEGKADSFWGNNVNIFKGSRNSILITNNQVLIGAEGRIDKNSMKGSRLFRISKSDYSLDPTWNPKVNGPVFALAISETGLYLGGNFTSVGGLARNHIARLNPNGSDTVDPTWNPNISGLVGTLALNEKDIFVGGAFSTINGVINRNNLVKISITGTGIADPTWNPNANNQVYGVALSGTDLYVAGNFSTIGGQSRIGIAKLSINGAGEADKNWNPILEYGPVKALAISGSDLYIGGYFEKVNGLIRNRIAKISAGGKGDLDPTWNPNVKGEVYSLYISGTDLFVGGNFWNIGGQDRRGIAKLSATGSGLADTQWNVNATYYGSPFTFLVSNNTVYTGGIIQSTKNADYVEFGIISAIAKISQTITFSLGVDSSKKQGDAPFSLTGTASSGLPLTYNSSDTTVASISGNILTIKKVGTSIITANQAGNNNYYAAAPISNTLTVNNSVASPPSGGFQNSVIVLYPNPADDELQIKIENPGVYGAIIFDEYGKIMESLNAEVKGNTFNISLKKLPTGIYVLQLSHNGETVIKRFIRQ